MSIATVVTRGFGSFGSIGAIVTRGFGGGPVTYTLVGNSITTGVPTLTRPALVGGEPVPSSGQSRMGLKIAIGL